MFINKYLLLILLSSLPLFSESFVDYYIYEWGLEGKTIKQEHYTISCLKEKKSHVAVLFDDWIKEARTIKGKGYERVVAFLVEARVIKPHIYKAIEKNMKYFDLVLTYDRYLLEKYPDKCRFVHALGDKFLFTPGIHQKHKLCSIIFSSKTLTKGHKLRHSVFNRYRKYFDGYKGPDAPPCQDKGEWQNEYCYSVIIENSRQEHYFTEKLTECMLSGTVPIYWGCPTIDRFFDKNGIITFSNIDELEPILRNLSFEDYQKRLPAIRYNYEEAKKYNPRGLDIVWSKVKDYF